MFQRLSQAYKISQSDHQNHLDLKNHHLYFHMGFEDLINEFKYALGGEKVMSNANIITILGCLEDIGFVDEQILEMLHNRVRNMLESQEQETPPQYHFQMEKKGYYDDSRQKAELLQQSQVFENVIKLTRIKLLKSS